MKNVIECVFSHHATIQPPRKHGVSSPIRFRRMFRSMGGHLAIGGHLHAQRLEDDGRVRHLGAFGPQKMSPDMAYEDMGENDEQPLEDGDLS